MQFGGCFIHIHKTGNFCQYDERKNKYVLIFPDFMEGGLLHKLRSWKAGMESKGLCVNMQKTKVMISGANLYTLKDSGEHPCHVCWKGVGVNSILCTGCSHWIHKKAVSAGG